MTVRALSMPLLRAAPARGTRSPWAGRRGFASKRNPVLFRAERSTKNVLKVRRTTDQNSAFPTVLGCGNVSRMLLIPVRYITMRSKPMP